MTNATRELRVQAEILHKRIQARDRRYLGRLRMGRAVSARLATVGGHTRIPRRLARSGPADRPLIASVFHNRLKLGMKLDCAPTAIYASMLEGRYRGKIHQSDPASRSRYGAYQRAGLPPGPIASPGAASLRAALAPAETNYLYFIARPHGSGRREFCRNIAAHRQAATRYRRGVAK